MLVIRLSRNSHCYQSDVGCIAICALLAGTQLVLPMNDQTVLQSFIHPGNSILKDVQLALISGPPFISQLGSNSNDDKRYCRNTPALPDDIVEFSFVVSDTGTHLRLKGFHGQNLDAYVNTVTDVKGQMLYE